MSTQPHQLRTALRPAERPLPPSGPERPAATTDEETGPSGRGHRAAGVLAVLLPALVAAYRCLDGIGARQMWRDEHASWWAATLNTADFRALLSNIDAVIAPYYLLLRAWTPAFGDSPASLRTPSAIAIAVSASLVALLARRVHRAAGGSDLSASLTGAGAGTAFALLPAVARYGQEARPYAFAVLLSLLAGVLLLRCLDGRSGAAWAWYGVTLTLAGAAHLVCLLVLPAHAAAVLTSWIRSRRAAVALNWLLATLLGLAGISVLVLRGNSQSKQIAWNNPTRDDLVQLPRDLLGSWPAAAVVLALALLGLWAARRHVGLLAVWALLPPLLTFATADRLHLFLDRYLLFTAAPVVVLAAAGTAWILSPLRRNTALGGVAVVLAATLLAGITVLDRSAMAAIRNNPVAEPDYRGAAALLAAEAKPGDGMVFNSQLNARRAFAYELRDRPAPTDVMLQYYPEDLGRFQGTECDDPSECARYSDRLWLVSTAAGPNPFAQMAAGTRTVLQEQFKVSSTRELHKIKVLLLERVQPAPSND
ncbi:glycosyltransferase family 39 protein [Kitasatospora sp. NPDC007106]